MPVYDTIVIGAGPAGATAARKLALQGYKVLLVEKEKLPRYKACGGGLTRKCYDLLDLDISDIVEDKIYKMVFSYNMEQPVEMESSDPWIYMVKRDIFDMRLVQKACEVGVELNQGEKVIDVNQGEDSVHIVTEKGTYTGKYAIAADGIFSVAREKFGMKKQYGIALEAEVFADQGILQRYTGTVKVDFKAINGGYAWIFPKSDSLSIGIGTFIKKSNNLRGLLYDFMREEGIPIESIVTLKGHPIALNDGNFDKFTAGKIVFAGDAAMLTDPFTGEGIYYAIKSGMIAAECIDEVLAKGGKNEIRDYDSIIKDTFIKDIRIAAFISNIFYRDFERVFAIVKGHPNITTYFGDLVCGRGDYRHMPFDMMRNVLGLKTMRMVKRSFKA